MISFSTWSGKPFAGGAKFQLRTLLRTKQLAANGAMTISTGPSTKASAITTSTSFCFPFLWFTNVSRDDVLAAAKIAAMRKRQWLTMSAQLQGRATLRLAPCVLNRRRIWAASRFLNKHKCDVCQPTKEVSRFLRSEVSLTVDIFADEFLRNCDARQMPGYVDTLFTSRTT